jgi:hypothetical protein
VKTLFIVRAKSVYLSTVKQLLIVARAKIVALTVTSKYKMFSVTIQ